MKKIFMFLIIMIFIFNCLYVYSSSGWEMDKTVRYLCQDTTALPEAKEMYYIYIKNGGSRTELINYLNDVSIKLQEINNTDTITEDNIKEYLKSTAKNTLFSSKYMGFRSKLIKIFINDNSIYEISSLYEKYKDTFIYLVFDEPNIFGINSDNFKYLDVNDNMWSYKYISALTEQGIINGDENSNFNPTLNVTRGEFAKMLALICDADINESSSDFNDVNPFDWYSPYIKWCSKNGYVNGIENNVFAPDDSITREQMCTILGRIIFNDSKINNNTESKFNDSAEISDYALKYTVYLNETGIICGDELNNLNPQKSLTREEAAAVLYRFRELICN